MDQAHGSTAAESSQPSAASEEERDDSAPRDDDERFIVGLVLTYYRRHPQRARTRLLDLLGEVLNMPAAGTLPSAPTPSPAAQAPRTPAAPSSDDEQALWAQTRSAVAPLKQKR